MSRLVIRPYTTSISLNGSSSFLTKANPAGVNSGTNPLTLMGWAMMRTNALMCFSQMKKTGSVQSPGFLLGQLAGTYYLGFDTINPGNNLTITRAQFDAAVRIGAWMHIAYVMTTSALSLYVNGNLVKTQSWGVAINTGAADSLYFGKGVDSGGANVYFWNGLLKDMHVCNGALSQAEIRSNMNDGTRPSSAFSEYLAEEGSGSSVADSINGNSLTGTSISWSSDVPVKVRSAASARSTASVRAQASVRSAA